ncbi:MAG: HDOD domain-containing protein [Gammaproteobacteria bacterium]|nr:HDOD domain-containing protein [Gammaproteobacteria bacterium]
MRVLFVDDEPNILNGIRRILRPLRKEWEMEFCESGKEALQALEKGDCDVIVSDMKMPGMDGAEFLSAIKDKHPDSIRIALSGETDSNMIFRCVQHAHQYLAKPCDMDVLTGTVNRALSLRSLVQDEELQKVIANMTSLPSLPEAYTAIMEELQSEDASLERIAKIIETDIAMSAKLLQIVNSSFFGLVRHISSPAEGAMFLGVDVIRSLVLTAGVFSQFDESKVKTEDLSAIWNQSLRVGAVAENIMLDVSGDKLLANYAMMGGLMSNVGKLVIAANFPDRFAEIQKLIRAGDRSEIDVEKDVMGHCHTDIGAHLLCIWGLPNPVVECVAYHHSPAACVEEHFVPVSAVHVATAIIDAGASDEPKGLDVEYIEKLGVADEIPKWVRAAHDTDADAENGGG